MITRCAAWRPNGRPCGLHAAEVSPHLGIPLCAGHLTARHRYQVLPPTIALRFNDLPTEWYVRGHVPDDVAIEAATPQAREDLGLEDEDDDRELPELRATRHLWGRWGFIRNDDDEIVTGGFHVSAKRTRGAFPVTEVVDATERERWRQQREARAARDQANADRLRALYPEAFDLTSNHGLVTFRLPGLEGPVRWNE